MQKQQHSVTGDRHVTTNRSQDIQAYKTVITPCDRCDRFWAGTISIPERREKLKRGGAKTFFFEFPLENYGSKYRSHRSHPLKSKSQPYKSCDHLLVTPPVTPVTPRGSRP